LRIDRALPATELEKVSKQDTPGSNEQAIDEDDDEIVIRPPPRAKSEALIFYDIVHSPSYQVPVLYITFTARALPTPAEMYDLLVPAAHRSAVDAVGVMGALSMTEHPITGCSAYFVHPCRTAEAMGAINGEVGLKPEQYLVRWIGLIGQSVGLNIPVELAVTISPTGGQQDSLT